MVLIIHTGDIRNAPGTAHRPFPTVTLVGGTVQPHRLHLERSGRQIAAPTATYNAFCILRTKNKDRNVKNAALWNKFDCRAVLCAENQNQLIASGNHTFIPSADLPPLQPFVQRSPNVAAMIHRQATWKIRPVQMNGTTYRHVIPRERMRVEESTQAASFNLCWLSLQLE